MKATDAVSVALTETAVRVPVKEPGVRTSSKMKPAYVPFLGRSLEVNNDACGVGRVARRNRGKDQTREA